MTDTPRTYAELQALFADNASGAISAQDLRDGFASVVSPVAGFPIGGAFYNRVTYMVVANIAGVATLPASSGSTTLGAIQVLPLDINGANVQSYSTDLGGYLDNTYSLSGADSHSAWGVDVDAHDAALLPTGAYFARSFCYFPAGITPDGRDLPVSVTFDQVYYDSAVEPSATAPWIYDGYYGSFFNSYQIDSDDLSGSPWTNVTTEAVVVNDKATPQPYALFGFTRGHTSAVDLQFYGIELVKLT